MCSGVIYSNCFRSDVCLRLRVPVSLPCLSVRLSPRRQDTTRRTSTIVTTTEKGSCPLILWEPYSVRDFGPGTKYRTPTSPSEFSFYRDCGGVLESWSPGTVPDQRCNGTLGVPRLPFLSVWVVVFSSFGFLEGEFYSLWVWFWSLVFGLVLKRRLF